MCDVCKLEGVDWKHATGGQKLSFAKLYRVYKDQEAKVRLCQLHDIELFRFGESRFLSAHLKLASLLISRSQGSDDFDFD